MKYRIESVVPLTFEDGKVLLPLQGNVIDLMKLDTAEEYKTVFRAIATQTLEAMVSAPAAPTTEPNAASPMQVPDFSGTAEKIREEFHRQARDSAERLKELASTYEDSVKTIDAATKSQA